MKRLLTAALVAAFPVAALPAPAQDQPHRFADFPDAAIVYYDVTGTSDAEIRRAMNAARPTSSSGERHDALTTWRFGVAVRPGGSGTCEVRVHVETQVIFPRLAAETRLRKNQMAGWNSYVTALEEHEAGHLARAYAVPATFAAPLEWDCGAAREHARAVIEQAGASQVAYDDATAHGRKTGAIFPRP
ncbi:DUF922 domain-containing protein [Parablastomonas sp. CN1-191]|uniref:DUF922 domain-containing protein n=1 Tax=Parablastomonas sp. CN1-191 TaxID=3400908 RepID=UPI003BF7A7A6